MKRIGIIAMAMALVLGLTQCKKEQNAQTNENETVAITLDIRNGGTRMDVNTVTGEVDYEVGDVIYVVSSGKYVGTLTHNGTNFSGPITNPTVGEPLHFYFLGNVTPAETLTAGTTESCSVVISDQTEKLPVIEYAPSDENYTAGATAFTAFLLNKCALVKFNVTTSSEAATCVIGFNNKVTVDFTDASFTYSKTNGGNITLPGGSGEKWAILLPQEAMEAGGAGSAYSQDGTYTGTCGAVPAIYDNGFLTAGIAVNVTTEVNPGEVPVGAISGKFTINENGDQVYFSQGNLQYIGSAATPYWKFADNQWDCLGTTTGQNSNAQNVDRDLFGWGTSGWNYGNIYYQPYDVESNYDPNTGYGYGPADGLNFNYNLIGDYANSDWGIYNAISNGGNIPGLWRTLSKHEWNYVFNTRSTLSGVRYAKAQVNGVNGVILLPDNWNTSVYSLNYVNASAAPYTGNMILVEDWTIIETEGATFLPAAGRREGTSVRYVGNFGHYWSVSSYFNRDAYGVDFTNGELYIMTYYRYLGLSVRLVHDVE